MCPSDVIWRYRFGLILVQVMGCLPAAIKPSTDPMSTSWWRRQMETFIRVTGPLCGEFSCHRWIPRTKASDAKRHVLSMHQKGAQNLSDLGNTHYKRSRQPNAGATLSVLLTPLFSSATSYWAGVIHTLIRQFNCSLIFRSGSLDNACVL